MERFAGIRFVLRHRAAINALFGLLPLAGGIYASLQTASLGALVAGIIAAPIVWLVVRVMLEVVDVVAETLIPR